MRTGGLAAVGEDVGGGARHRCGVVDGADFGQAFTVSFLALGQAGAQFRGRGVGGFRGGRAQSVGTHHDALTVDGAHQHRFVFRVLAGVGRRRRALGVEVIEVGRCRDGEPFDLAFTQSYAGVAADRGDRVVERAAGGFDRGQSSQPVRVFLGRQVQLGVGRVQIRSARCPIRHSRHADLAEHGGQRAGVAGLDPGTHHSIGADHLGAGAFAVCAQVHAVLEQLPQQLTALALQLGLQLGMIERGGLGAVKPVQRRAEQRPRRDERVGFRARRPAGHSRLPARRAASRERNAATPSPAAASSAARPARSGPPRQPPLPRRPWRG